MCIAAAQRCASVGVELNSELVQLATASIKENPTPDNQIKQIDVEETSEKIEETLGISEDLYQKFIDAYNAKQDNYREFLRNHILKKYLQKRL